jgi:hypothetical protein
VNSTPAHIPSTWTRVAGIHIGNGKFSAVWGAHDRMRDVVTLYDEMSVPLGALPVHAEAVVKRGKWIPVLIDLDVGGASERDGRLAMAQRLADLGINLADVPVDGDVAASDLQARAQTGRLKIWTTCTDLPKEWQNYRRDETTGDLPDGFGLMRAAGLVVGPGLAVAMSETVAASEREGYEVANPTRNPTTGY